MADIPSPLLVPLTAGAVAEPAMEGEEIPGAEKRTATGEGASGDFEAVTVPAIPQVIKGVQAFTPAQVQGASAQIQDVDTQEGVTTASPQEEQGGFAAPTVPGEQWGVLEAAIPSEAVEAKRWYSDFKISGYLKNETAFRYREPRSLTKLRNIVFLNVQYPFDTTAKLNYSGWAYHDAVYNLFDYDTIAARFEREIEQPIAYIVGLPKEKDTPKIDLRELYLDLYLGKVDVRLGKQIIVWGVLEGVRIVDEVNPQDFRELILAELLDYRIPLWSAKFDFYTQPANFEFIWIPEIQPHRPAPRGSEWELLQEVPNSRYPKSMTFRNSEMGLKVSTNLWDTELTFSYFYTWDDFPTVFRWVRMNSSQEPVFLPTYTRINMYGATAVKQLGEYILKGEFAYVKNKYFAIADLDENGDGILDNFGEVQRDHIRWGLGLDFNLWGVDISPSVTQWVILDYKQGMVQDKFDSAFNVFLRKEFPESSTVFTLLGIYLINFKETYYKPKLVFHLTDRLQAGIGVDIFQGVKSRFGVAIDPTRIGGIREITQEAHFLGNFDANDRAFAEFKYSF